MDCSICLDSITKETGLVTLSCCHNFHFRCIDEWFYKQLVQGHNQTCPCCRNEGTGLDRCAFEETEAEDDDDDDETYEEDDVESQDANSILDEIPEDMNDLLWERAGEGRWILTSRTETAFQGLRSLFGPLNNLEVQEETYEEVAARKIQAIFRGYKVRNSTDLHNAARALVSLFAARA